MQGVKLGKICFAWERARFGDISPLFPILQSPWYFGHLLNIMTFFSCKVAIKNDIKPTVWVLILKEECGSGSVTINFKKCKCLIFNASCQILIDVTLCGPPSKIFKIFHILKSVKRSHFLGYQTSSWCSWKVWKNGFSRVEKKWTASSYGASNLRDFWRLQGLMNYDDFWQLGLSVGLQNLCQKIHIYTHKRAPFYGCQSWSHLITSWNTNISE